MFKDWRGQLARNGFKLAGGLIRFDRLIHLRIYKRLHIETYTDKCTGRNTDQQADRQTCMYACITWRTQWGFTYVRVRHGAYIYIYICERNCFMQLDSKTL